MPPLPTIDALRLSPRLTRYLRDWLLPLVATLLLCAVFAVDSWQSFNAAKDQARQSLSFNTRASAWAMRTELMRVEILLHGLAESIVKHSDIRLTPDLVQISKKLQDVQLTLPRRPDLYYANLDGKIVASASPSLIGRSLTDSTNVGLPGTEYGTSLAIRFGDRAYGIEGNKVLEFSKAVTSTQGKVLGTVSLAGKQSAVRELLEATFPENQEVVTVLSNTGQVLVQTQPNAAFTPSVPKSDYWGERSDFKAHVTGGASSSMQQATDTDGGMFWVAYRTVENYPLVIATTLPDVQTLGQWTHANLIRWGVVTGALLLIFWFSLINLRRQRAITIAHRRFSALIENSEDVIAIINSTGKVTWASPSMSRVTGYAPSSIIGEHFSKSIHREDHPALELGLHRLQTTPQLRISLYCHIKSKQRGWIPVEGTATAHFDTPGIDGAIIIYRDVSERESHTLALTESEQMLNQAQKIAELGSWRYDPATRSFNLSDEASHILGIDGTRKISRRSLLSFVHRADRKMVAKAWRATLDGEEYDLGHRIVVAGETRWVHARANLFFDDFGRVSAAVGTLQDATAQHFAAMQLSELLEFNQEIINTSAVGLAVLSADGHCVMANAAIAHIVGTQPENIQSLNFRNMPVWRDNGILAAAEATLTTGEPHVVRYSGMSTFETPIAVEFKFSAINRHGERHLLLLLTDISEFEASTRAMTEARKLAEEANRAKSEFLANMSHEIRTPLNAVIGLAQLSLDRTADATLREYLMQMGQSANALLEIINDILDYSKIEAGRLSLDNHEFSVRDITARVIGLFRQAAGAKGVELSTEVADDVPTRLHGDSTRITQIVVNLVANAVKFTDTGSVTLSIRRQSAAKEAPAAGAPTTPPTEAPIDISFEVTDTGIGMSPEAVAGLFQPFKQGDGSTTRRYGGTGLGLTISRRLTSLMNGRIEVSSTPGQGSRFTLILPIQPGAAHIPSRTTPARSAAVGHTSEIALRGQAINGAHILLVEDDRVNQMVIERLLQRCGVRVTIAKHGQEALERLAQAELDGGAARFDAVLMDLQMPVMDGFAATRAIRADGRWATLPIIAVTAAVLTHDESACLAAGMTGYLHKPVQPLALIDILVRQLTKSSPTLNAEASDVEIPVAPLNQPLTPEHLRESLLALQTRLIAHEFIAITELHDIRTLLGTLADARAERLDGAISRYDYGQAQAIMSDLISSLPISDSPTKNQDA